MATIDDDTSKFGVNDVPKAKPTGRQTAYFIVIAGDDVGQMYKLTGTSMVIGRSKEAEIFIQDTGISRAHARVTKRPDGKYEIEDEGSTNGTHVNDDRISAHVLNDGDRVLVGTSTILKFSLQDELEEDFHKRQYDSANRDALTDCFNRRYFLERLPTEFAFAARHGQPISLGMFDIDNFKLVNDTHGHLCGDQVIKNTARLCIESIRKEDELARFGGDEFALLLRATDEAQARIVGERIRSSIAESHVDYESKKIQATVSIGIATLTANSKMSPEELMRAADEALYEAKRQGRNNVQIFESLGEL